MKKLQQNQQRNNRNARNRQRNQERRPLNSFFLRNKFLNLMPVVFTYTNMCCCLHSLHPFGLFSVLFGLSGTDLNTLCVENLYVTVSILSYSSYLFCYVKRNNYFFAFDFCFCLVMMPSRWQ